MACPSRLCHAVGRQRLICVRWRVLPPGLPTKNATIVNGFVRTAEGRGTWVTVASTSAAPNRVEEAFVVKRTNALRQESEARQCTLQEVGSFPTRRDRPP